MSFAPCVQLSTAVWSDSTRAVRGALNVCVHETFPFRFRAESKKTQKRARSYLPVDDHVGRVLLGIGRPRRPRRPLRPRRPRRPLLLRGLGHALLFVPLHDDVTAAQGLKTEKRSITWTGSRGAFQQRSALKATNYPSAAV